MCKFEDIIINLNKVDDIKKFMEITRGYTEDIDIKRDRLIIDGKSFLGILSIDLSKNIKVNIHTIDKEVYENFNNDMEKFKVYE